MSQHFMNFYFKTSRKTIQFLIYIIYFYMQSNTFHNKRPMGDIAHMRKQFKSINAYD